MQGPQVYTLAEESAAEPGKTGSPQISAFAPGVTGQGVCACDRACWGRCRTGFAQGGESFSCSNLGFSGNSTDRPMLDGGSSFCRRTDGRLGTLVAVKAQLFNNETTRAKNADYRGGVTCLYDTQLLGVCLHAFESSGRSRPEAVRGMPDVPSPPQPPGPRRGGRLSASSAQPLQHKFLRARSGLRVLRLCFWGLTVSGPRF